MDNMDWDFFEDDGGFFDPIFPNYSVWTTRDGKEIYIKHIGDSHLLNIIAMLKRTMDRDEPGTFNYIICEGYVEAMEEVANKRNLFVPTRKGISIKEADARKPVGLKRRITQWLSRKHKS